jgi:predicted GIY-YIG superfamily endonuclease
MAFSQEIGECPEFIEGQYIMNYYTYIILCNNNKYYIGHASNLNKRFTRHLQKSGAKFTAQNPPTKILWKQRFETEIEAIRREKQIKGWTREKKENLIKGIWK